MVGKKRDINSELTAQDPMTAYCHFMYSNLGKLILKNPKFKNFFQKNIYNKKYEEILKKANLKLLPEEYFLTVFITIIYVIFLTVLLAIVSMFVLPKVTIFLFYGGIIGVVLVGFSLYNYPIVVSKNRAEEIDAAIPYLLPYMKILAKELNLSKIVNLIDQFLIYKEIKVEFTRIKYYSEFLGYDINSSIKEAMQSCPSRDLADLMNDLVTISNSGGDIFAYLERKLENLNTEIEAIEKKNIDTLLIYSQVYVVALLIAPLFFTIMSSILSLIESSASASTGSLGGGGGGDSTGTIIIMLFGLPFAYIGFMMLIYYTKPLYSRLKPIKNA